ncbi:hypothetical protein [Streptomyces lydicus]|uniref:hypothetical protein n=1 Tax=Streptomyces lydicus TaxID=47763 RepID=UPI001F514589|nr:hypothetical protein [Streptomyces lydicus]
MVLAAAARAAATPLRRTREALDLLEEAQSHLTAISRPAAAELDAVGMVALTAAYTAAYTAAQAQHPALARNFAAQAEQTAHRLAHAPDTTNRPAELSAQQCTLYRIGIDRELGDLDTALAYAAALEPATLPTPERRARAATDTARALLAADDAAGAFAQLRLVKLVAPLEARRPSVRTLTARIAEHRPDLPGLAEYTRRTATPGPYR